MSDAQSAVPDHSGADQEQTNAATSAPATGASATLSDAENTAAGSGKAAAQRRRRRKPLDRMALVRLVRGHAAPPAATRVATLLLLADAVARSGHDLREVQEILRRPRPIVAITGTVPGFEAAFLDLLKGGFVLAGRSSVLDGFDLRSINDYRGTNGTCRNLVLFRGREMDENADYVARKVRFAVHDADPILAVADDPARLPDVLFDTADLNLACNPVSAGLIVQTMQVVLGQAASLADAEACASRLAGCELLSITDLGLAIRPGMSVERSLQVLSVLIARNRQAGDGKAASGSKPGKNASSSNHTIDTRRGKIGTGSTVVEPEPIDHGGKAMPALRVEALAGYGEATDWALALKSDLELWKAGRLEWSEMSTRLLLAGPPGTGKTTFARALANTLQLRLYATSVGTWLEPSHLGDVLARMAAAFAEAEANAPCILFVDEIDGIGRRGAGARDYDDYWISVVNRALELLDGAVKSQGVIILGATNHPEAIDRALLRSGRLETRIDIPLPDVDALVAILRHHLKEDVAAVVESAQAALPERVASGGTDPVEAGAGPAIPDTAKPADAERGRR